ncbi:hypothetical protein KIL84_022033 [Mauremys mutica]|uniref:Secreted protein n=1 Tax=Mauremys mutica TaxID=74926 RepID=A0A9D3XI35_9SAUR|nr:hypothetical protein KIL84_022033 [Mauremys mutica]
MPLSAVWLICCSSWIWEIHFGPGITVNRLLKPPPTCPDLQISAHCRFAQGRFTWRLLDMMHGWERSAINETGVAKRSPPCSAIHLTFNTEVQPTETRGTFRN